MHLKSAAELVGPCRVSQKLKLMPPLSYVLGTVATLFIKPLSNQGKGSNAHFAFARCGFVNELGDVFRFSGEQVQILIL